MRRWLAAGACAGVLCVILALGWWPLHIPRNDVSWLADRNGLHFGRYSTVFSSGPLERGAGLDGGPVSVEVWLQPGRIWDFSTFLAFDAPGDPFRFSLRQWQLDLFVHARTQELLVRNVFPRKGATFLTITAGEDGTVVYVNGVEARRAPGFRLSGEDLAGRLVLGDSPGQSDTWRGQLFGVAIYRQELTAAEVMEHFHGWTQLGKPAIGSDSRVVALYLFDGHAGRVVDNRAGAGASLYIPQKYTVLDQLFLETPWSEYRRTQDFWGAVTKNIIGFVPFGCCFCAYLSLMRRMRRATVVTVLLGFGVSLMIELVQAFLPMRASGMMDLVTNTLGTYLGVLVYEVFRPVFELLLG